MTVVQSPRQSLDNPDVDNVRDVKDAETKETDSTVSISNDEEYPQAIQLFFITIAVMFSIFLCALDQVSPCN